MCPQTTHRTDYFCEHDLCKDDSYLWPFLSWKMTPSFEYLISFLLFYLVLRIHLSLGYNFCPVSISFVYFFLSEFLKYLNLGISLSDLPFFPFNPNECGFALITHCCPPLKVHMMWFNSQVKSLFPQL